MNTPRPQLTVSTSRGCPFKCTYCQWPKVMNNGQYRNRGPEFVVDEIRSVIHEYKSRKVSTSGILDNAMINVGNLRQRRVAPLKAVTDALLGGSGEIRSIFFDDDTWNLGTARIRQLCKDLKEINLPWTMMGRIDTSSLDLYDLMVESGCVGMRFGIESFNQRLLDNTKKNLDASKSFDNIRYLLSRFSKMEFHFTTMKNLPGEKGADWDNDTKLLNELKAIGEKSGNRVHWQNSNCIAFPGTELWEEMVALGKGDELRNFDLYDGNPRHDDTLAQAVGWLGSDYTPKWSKYSKMGEPTNLPSGQ
jgi:anaerobic magnesium-protoporphyrin IX monomethyl ester cyclase